VRVAFDPDMDEAFVYLVKREDSAVKQLVLVDEELAAPILVDLDGEGHVIGFEFPEASQILSATFLEQCLRDDAPKPAPDSRSLVPLRSRYRRWRKSREFRRWEKAVHEIGRVAYNIQQATGCTWEEAHVKASRTLPRDIFDP
jgi:uncharacterized protein YuzE